MRSEFLLEIGTEEIPASFEAPALESLTELMSKALSNARLEYGSIETYATPRRIILRIIDLESMQPSIEIEKVGPSKAAAFDKEGKPTKAALGFAKSQGVDVSELMVIATPKGEQLGIRRTEKGRPTAEVLSEALPYIMEKISFPKTMRWMDLDVKFARPIHWLVSIYNGKVVPFSYGDISSGNTSTGHRFLGPKSFDVSNFAQLRETLAKPGVEIDPEARYEAIKTAIEDLAHKNGFKIFDDPDLLSEVNFLVESPYPVMGMFSQDFLELPASILITCMKKHQRYFSVQGSDGHITNKFIAVNNTPVKEPSVSIKGHQRVLKARLEDARFYYREDRKAPLFDRLAQLKGVVFHSKLGTAYEKVERFTALAESLAERLDPDKLDKVKRASLLSKCDLETGIVYEFPELQGIIGSYYAKMDGEDEDVATAIREHYLPAHSGDQLPSGIVGAIVSIADRMDTIAGCFSVGLIPTGAADPYALRRHALAVIQIVMSLGAKLNLEWLVEAAIEKIGAKRTRNADEIKSDVMEFFKTRFINFHTSRDFPLDAVEAVVRARFDDLVDARQRVEALADWKQSPDFDAIMIGFKRVMNILKDSPKLTKPAENLFEEPAEKDLYTVFKAVVAGAEPLIQKGKYAEALVIIAELKSPIDTLFDKVMVMVEDDKLRNNRLAMLKEIGDFFKEIADFSFIGSTAQKA
jgi:glycyl-tRNA synthetase beta chain